MLRLLLPLLPLPTPDPDPECTLFLDGGIETRAPALASALGRAGAVTEAIAPDFDARALEPYPAAHVPVLLKSVLKPLRLLRRLGCLGT